MSQSSTAPHHARLLDKAEAGASGIREGIDKVKAGIFLVDVSTHSLGGETPEVDGEPSRLVPCDAGPPLIKQMIVERSTWTRTTPLSRNWTPSTRPGLEVVSPVA